MEYTGILEFSKPNVAHLRQVSLTLAPRPNDPYVSRQLIRDYKLKEGVLIEADIVDGGKKHRSRQVERIKRISHLSVDDWRDLVKFEDQTVIDPQPQVVLEPRTNKHEIPYRTLSVRTIDLICPLGFGQRALIVAPPRTGKTILLQQMAIAIKNNYSNIDLIMLLVDERPEEVTEMRRVIPGEVFASSNDCDNKSHARIGRVIVEYAKSLAQSGRDVVLMLDSLTRLSRAYNVSQRGSGRTLTGGLDARALEIPKRLFGAARKLENGGSLTIIATVLVETGSRMDDYVFQEYKGTGNMELALSRDLSNERIFPSIDIPESGTRKEELLVGDKIAQYNVLRRHLTKLKPKEAMQALTQALSKFATNSELLEGLTLTA